MRYLIAVLVAFSACCFNHQLAFGDVAADAKKFCQEKWPSDYSMQEHCIDKMQSGIAGLRKIEGRYGDEGEEWKILERC